MKLPLIILAICTAAAGFIPFGNYVSAQMANHWNLIFILYFPLLLLHLVLPVFYWLCGCIKMKMTGRKEYRQRLGGLYKTAYQ